MYVHYISGEPISTFAVKSRTPELSAAQSTWIQRGKAPSSLSRSVLTVFANELPLGKGGHESTDVASRGWSRSATTERRR